MDDFVADLHHTTSVVSHGTLEKDFFKKNGDFITRAKFDAVRTYNSIYKQTHVWAISGQRGNYNADKPFSLENHTEANYAEHILL